MSQLLPSNLSKARRKPEKRHTLFTCDYPATYEVGGEKPSIVLDAEVRPQNPGNLSGAAGGEKSSEGNIRRRPVPVVMVNQDPLQEMEPDECGAELGKDARVWKVYVQETDRWDAELVDGWNKSLDVILVFAALFSAVSTAFLIESSGKLQQDPNDVSAAALVTISQVLSAMANNTAVDLPASDPTIASGFVPSQHAIIINTLWYLSLSLSIATSLLAMLAKDWCHSFSASRTGHPWDQALRRQRKWVMIERWKMQELITILPSLIHLSLLLFAVGLCIYVWDINTTVAMPIICVSGAAFSFYVWSSMMASVIRLFPYTTIISRTLQSDFMHRQYALIRKHWTKHFVSVLRWTRFVLKFARVGLRYILLGLFAVMCLPILLLDISRWIFPGDDLPEVWVRREDGHSRGTFWLWPVVWLDKFIQRSMSRARQYTEFATPALGDQGEMTSLALKWLIQNCETPSSVTIALQAIAGASSRIPSKPLRDCQASLGILRRLVSSGPANSTGWEAELYSRALTFLESQAEPRQKGKEQVVVGNDQGKTQKNERTGDIEVAIWDLKSEHERQVVDWINSISFSPTGENIAALTMGNSATSLALRLLKGDRQAASKALGSIMDLFDLVQSGNLQLNPPALHSLGHAAVVLTSCSEDPLMTHDQVQRWMEHCLSRPLAEVINPLNLSQSHLVNAVLQPETVIVICVLMHGYSATQNIPASDQPQTRANIRIKRGINLLLDKRLARPTYQAAFCRIGLLEVIFKPEQYRVKLLKEDESRQKASIDFLNPDLLRTISPDDRGSSIPKASGNDDGARVLEFLESLSQLQELVEALSSKNSLARCMPAPAYCVLICIAFRTRSEAQRTLCERLLSYAAFPRLDNNFTFALEEASRRLWPKRTQPAPTQPGALSGLKKYALRKNVEDPFKARLRHFVATQTWLLLCLVGDSSADLQKGLESIIRDHMHQDTDFNSLTVHQARHELEKTVIETYENDHHLGVYSARVIECIIEARKLPSDAELSRRIQGNLTDVPSCIRGLSSFLDRAEVRILKNQYRSRGGVLSPEPGRQPDKLLPDGQLTSIPVSLSVPTTNTGRLPSTEPSRPSTSRAPPIKPPKRQDTHDVKIDVEPPVPSPEDE